MVLGSGWKYNLVEPGNGNGNGNKSLRTEGSRIGKDIPTRLSFACTGLLVNSPYHVSRNALLIIRVRRHPVITHEN